MSKTKYMIASIVYYGGLVATIGLGLGLIVGLFWYVITTIPFMLAIMAVLVSLIGMIFLMGWAEDYVGRYEGYHKKK